MKNKLTIINQDSGYLMIDIANAYTEAGYEVSLITGRLVERNTPLDPSIKLDKICRYNRSNIPMRLISWFWGLLQILFKIWFRYGNSHLFIVSNPPFAPLIPLVCKNAYSLLIFDVYIEKPAEFPLIGKITFLVNLWKKAHKKALVKAEKIFTLTEGMKKSIEKYSGGKPVDIVPIWTDNEFFKPVPPEINPFISKHQLEGKFIVLYSGNIGTSSGVEAIIDVAALVKSEKIKFVLIGKGARKETIVEKIKKFNLENCLLLPWQEADVLPYSLASANLAVVSLVGKSSKRSIPSKLFNFLSVGAPILGIADLDSDLAKLINQYDIGTCFSSENQEQISEYINQLSINPEQCLKYSQNALNASKDYTIKNVLKFL